MSEESTETKKEPVTITREEKVALFDTYDGMATKIAKLEAELKETKAAASDHVKKIKNLFESNGPFVFKGKQLMVSHKGDTWFFKVRSDDGAEVIG
jgi:hypothetical protein